MGMIQFERPSWQDEAVGSFLDSLPNGTYDGLFNPNGRVRRNPPFTPFNSELLHFNRPSRT